MHIFIFICLAGLALTKKNHGHKTLAPRPCHKPSKHAGTLTGGTTNTPSTNTPEVATAPKPSLKPYNDAGTLAGEVTTTPSTNTAEQATAFDIGTLGLDQYTIEIPTVSTVSGYLDELHRPDKTPGATRPCNNYYEFCGRRYSNITEVGAHNSPFHLSHSLASNQAVGVTEQLKDGIRLLQGQVRYVNGTLYYCHTSCHIQNGGTVEDYLRNVTQWLDKNQNDVVTIIFGNGDYNVKYLNGTSVVTAKTFVDPIEKSGLSKYIYHPPKAAMTLEDWPILGDMIRFNQRVVTFIDYNADTDAVPWLLPQFESMWETPFSQTNIRFPCTLDRPKNIDFEKQKQMLYMANHNLNIPMRIMGMKSLIPAKPLLNQTNGLVGKGSLGLMMEECTERYNRPPNFVLVDYYGHGPSHGIPAYKAAGRPFNGSVFYAAAEANGVTYSRNCCAESGAGGSVSFFKTLLVGLAIGLFTQALCKGLMSAAVVGRGIIRGAVFADEPVVLDDIEEF